MEITYEDFPEQLRLHVSGFAPVYDEHLVDNFGEVLPHVLLGALVRFLSSEVELLGAGAPSLKQAVDLLEGALSTRDPRLEELIVVSFLENLELAAPSHSAIRNRFGPELERQYRRFLESR